MQLSVLRHLLALAGFTVAALVGRATVVEGSDTALVWPAAGVGLLWYLSTPRRSRWVVLVLLGASTLAINLVTGSTLWVSMVFMLTNVLQTVLTSWMLETHVRGWPVVSWTVPFTTPHQLTRLLLVTGLSSVPVVAVGALGLWSVDGSFNGAATISWWGRNGVGMMGVVAVGLLLRESWKRPRSRALPSPARVVEAVALFVLTGALVLLDLWQPHASFVHFLPAFAVWAGARFRPAFVAVHSMASGAGAIALASTGVGPFAEVDSPWLATVVVQVFIGVVVVLGLVLAMAREQNALLTERLRQARDESEHQAKLLDAVLGSMQDGVIVVDHDNWVVLVNRAASQTVFADVENPCATHLSDYQILHPDGTPVPLEERPSVRALSGSTNAMEVLIESAGVVRRFATRATPLAPGLDGDAVLLLRDVTDERNQQEELVTFAGTVAHDLRNPISAIEMWAELLEMSLGPEPADDAKRAVDRIRSSTERARQLIDDLLTDARSRHAAITLAPVDLATLTRAASEQVPNADVRILPMPTAMGDASLLLRVLGNLLVNAVKYADPDRDPEITVSGESNEFGEVVVRVSDRGIGIPTDLLEAVFESFRRVPGTNTAGTGLGLAICRRIVERHGGRIRARRRTDGPGTVMEFTLPAAPLRDRAASLRH